MRGSKETPSMLGPECGGKRAVLLEQLLVQLLRGEAGIETRMADQFVMPA